MIDIQSIFINNVVILIYNIKVFYNIFTEKILSLI